MRAVYVNTSTSTFKSRIEHRNRVELLRSRVYLLRGRDRLLMTMYLEHGNTMNQMARMSGKNPSTIYRRIRRLVKVLLDGEYIKCLRFRDRFSKTEMVFAREFFLEGISYREISRRHCCSVYKVSKIIMNIREVLEGNK